MDRLHAYILILQAKVERERLRRRVAELEGKLMSRNLQGLGEALKKLRHNSEMDAEALLKKIEDVNARREVAVKAAHAGIDATVVAAVKEVEAFVAELEGSNGGPSLDGSGQPLPEPQKSWSGGGQG